MAKPQSRSTFSFRLESEGKAARLILSGGLDTESAARWWKAVIAAGDQAGGHGLEIDAADVDYCDGAGLAMLVEISRRAVRSGREVRILNLRPEFQRLLDQFDPATYRIGVQKPDRPISVLVETGRAALDLFYECFRLIAFVGELSAALFHALLHPRRIRWGDTLRLTELAGVNGLPIVALIGFLVGLIISFQSAIPLRQFGADIFVADMIALGMLRELGPLMTAIILAGRTGSAFAAELGTMRVNEEIDALTTMGLRPVRFLVVPRVLAAVVVTPMLTLFADFMGLVGGAVVLLSLGYPFVAYYQHAVAAVGYGDLLGGLAKSFVFGILVAGVGCLRGLQTRTGASAVGDSTTRAVVSGIVLIAVADGIFAVIFYYLDI